MKLHNATAALSVLMALGLSSTGAVQAGAQPALLQVQYDRYPDQRDGYYPPYRGERRDDYSQYPSRDGRDYPLWRPGDVVPGQALDFVVDDWEPRGLQRPPGGHQWFRVPGQFILVRERDRMISRVITFE